MVSGNPLNCKSRTVSITENKRPNVRRSNTWGKHVQNNFLSARKADLKKGFQHLVVVVLVVLVLVVGTRAKKRF
jgi:t-SNARE complex subunit (syntaxin)